MAFALGPGPAGGQRLTWEAIRGDGVLGCRDDTKTTSDRSGRGAPACLAGRGLWGLVLLEFYELCRASGADDGDDDREDDDRSPQASSRGPPRPPDAPRDDDERFALACAGRPRSSCDDHPLLAAPNDDAFVAAPDDPLFAASYDHEKLDGLHPTGQRRR